MGKRDSRVDSYIAASAAFAKPILTHLRSVVHEACPDVEETMKWRFPHFMYHGILCSMASFKAHCAFGFWKGALVLGTEPGAKRDAMGSFGRIASVRDLPPRKELVRMIREAMRLNEEGVPSPTRSKAKVSAKPEPAVPPALQAALKKNRKAKSAFEGFSPSHRREYVEWITDAKREETRQKRIEKTIAQLSEGKGLNWKYQ